MSEKESGRYEDFPQHTHTADCPACKALNQELSPEDKEELVNALMKQFDGMIDRGAAKLKLFAKGKLSLIDSLLKDEK